MFFICFDINNLSKLNKVYGSENFEKDAHLIEFQETGYYVINDVDKKEKIIFDCGEVGIREVASHGHSDLLSYEMSFDGERIVVDTGTSIYASGPRRQFERSIFAHNAISVDGLETCEPWSDYRMARRGHPGEVRTVEQDGIVIIVMLGTKVSLG